MTVLVGSLVMSSRLLDQTWEKPATKQEMPLLWYEQLSQPAGCRCCRRATYKVWMWQTIMYCGALICRHQKTPGSRKTVWGAWLQFHTASVTQLTQQQDSRRYHTLPLVQWCQLVGQLDLSICWDVRSALYLSICLFLAIMHTVNNVCSFVVAYLCVSCIVSENPYGTYADGDNHRSAWTPHTTTDQIFWALKLSQTTFYSLCSTTDQMSQV